MYRKELRRRDIVQTHGVLPPHALQPPQQVQARLASPPPRASPPRPPVRARLTIALLVLLPLTLSCIHAATLGWSASAGFLFLTGAAAIGAIVIATNARLRTLTDAEVTKSPLVRGIAIASLVMAEGFAVAVVVPEGLAERRIA